MTGAYLPVLSYSVVEDNERRNKLGAAALERRLSYDRIIRFKLETGSVYGVAIALPQIARSANWPVGFRGLAGNCCCFVLLLYTLVFTLICMVQKEHSVMDKYGGKMNLCDFGAFMKSCDGCGIGPFGSEITPPRLYSWDAWVARAFVRDSLKAIFPDKASEIAEKIDPGEWGLENYWCRFACIFLFMIKMMEEFFHILRMAYMLFYASTCADSWISYKGELLPDDQLTVTLKSVDDVELEFKGIPGPWKAFYWVLLFLPKCIIFCFIVACGVEFLMETAGMDDVIVNAVALSFVLSIDEMIFSFLVGNVAKEMMDQLKVVEPSENKTENNEPTQNNSIMFAIRYAFRVLPTKLFVVIILTLLSLAHYYWRHCRLIEGGSILGGWLSKDVYLPTTDNPLTVFFPDTFFAPENQQPYWTMPSN